MSAETDTTIDTLSALLRGELAAVATYRQAERKRRGGPGAAELGRVRREHQGAADALRLAVQSQGGRPPEGAGAWGALAGLAQGAAALLGGRASVRMLRVGEEQSIDEYESALDGPALPAECESLIAGSLLPRCRAHLQALDRLLAG